MNVFVGDLDAIVDRSSDGKDLEPDVGEREEKGLTKINEPTMFLASIQVRLIVKDHDIEIAAGVEFAAAIATVGDQGQLASIVFRLGLKVEDFPVERLDHQVEHSGPSPGDGKATAAGAMFDSEAMGLDLKEIPILGQVDGVSRPFLESEDFFGAGFGLFQ